MRGDARREWEKLMNGEAVTNNQYLNTTNLQTYKTVP
jgi:hypothetical protein